MAYYPLAYNTQKNEVSAIGSGAGVTMAPGTAVQIDALPTSSVIHFKISPATGSDPVHGVVSTVRSATPPSIDNIISGRVVTMASDFIPVLMGANGNAGDLLKIDANSKWVPIGAGDVAKAELLETTAMNALGWARPILFKP